MSTRAAITPEARSGLAEVVPPLEPGDHLSRDEFERRYEAMPGAPKAELIEGVVYMAPPAVRWDYHATPHSYLTTWLGTYALATPGLQLGDNGSVRLDLDNEPQPDAALVIQPAFGGQARFADDGFLEGAPELAAEVSGTSVSIDLNAKLHAYRRNGVKEYLVWRVRDRVIDWFALSCGQYEPLPRLDAIIRSEVFPGLWLAPDDLINHRRTALATLHQGLASPEYAAFVSRLRAAGAE
jgi:Uma2 family endonuclease